MFYLWKLTGIMNIHGLVYEVNERWVLFTSSGSHYQNIIIFSSKTKRFVYKMDVIINTNRGKKEI